MKYQNFKIVGDLKTSDKIMKNAFWVGVYPGLSKADLNKISLVIHKFINKNT